MKNKIKLEIVIPREEALKIKKNKNILEKVLTLFTCGVSNLCMPGQHAHDKCCLAAWIPRTLYKRLKKRGKELGFRTVTEFAEFLIIKETKDIELTPEEYEQIAEETRRASQRTRNKRLQKKVNPLG